MLTLSDNTEILLPTTKCNHNNFGGHSKHWTCVICPDSILTWETCANTDLVSSGDIKHRDYMLAVRPVEKYIKVTNVTHYWRKIDRLKIP